MVTRVSSSSGSSGVVQPVCTLPLHSVVLINKGEFPLDEVTDSFWEKAIELKTAKKDKYKNKNT